MADIVFAPSYNEAPDRFHKIADNHVTDSPSYVIISNAACFGGTSIYGQLHKKHLRLWSREDAKNRAMQVAGYVK